MHKYFSQLTDRYFNHWISLPTWDSRHPLDMQRFYQFVKALRKYSRKPWQTKFHENIQIAAKANHPTLNDKYVTEMADLFLAHAEIIFAYDAVRFDPCIEMRNPHDVRISLRRMQSTDGKGGKQPLYTPEQIEQILVDNFGINWKDRKIKNKQRKF
jgi:hypothetical protein